MHLQLWLNSKKKRPFKNSPMSLFKNNCRYIDDIFTVNNLNFLKLEKQIYPKDLTLNKANITSDICQFNKHVSQQKSQFLFPYHQVSN